MAALRTIAAAAGFAGMTAIGPTAVYSHAEDARTAAAATSIAPQEQVTVIDMPAIPNAEATEIQDKMLERQYSGIDNEDTIYVVNYTFDAPKSKDPLAKASRNQTGFLQAQLPIIAQTYGEKIVLINAPAYYVKPNGELQSSYAKSLIDDYQNNNLGGPGKSEPFNPDTDTPTMPFGYTQINGKQMTGFSMILGEPEKMLGSINTAISGDIAESQGLFQTASLER